MVLVGHSGAGALLPAVAAALPGRVRAALFVDALLPHPGRSWFDTAAPELREQLRSLAREGRLPPWHEWFPAGAVAGLLPDATVRERFLAEVPELPLAYFEERAPEVPDWSPARCGYVRLSEAYDREAGDAAALGWPVYREDADHLAMLTRPAAVAELLGRLVSAYTS